MVPAEAGDERRLVRMGQRSTCTAACPHPAPHLLLPQVSLAPQDTIPEQDRASGEDSASSSSSSAEGRRRKSLFRRSVLWGHQVRGR